MVHTSRREFIAGGGALLASGLAGCLGTGGASGGGEEGLSVETLDAAGSSGGSVPVVPSGRVVLLDFWATWCAPCKPQMKELRQIRDRFPDVHMLSITNENDREAIRGFWEEYRGTWPVAMDPELRTNERFDVNRIPTLLVLTPDGEEVWRHVGLAAADTIAGKIETAR